MKIIQRIKNHMGKNSARMEMYTESYLFEINDIIKKHPDNLDLKNHGKFLGDGYTIYEDSDVSTLNHTGAWYTVCKKGLLLNDRDVSHVVNFKEFKPLYNQLARTKSIMGRSRREHLHNIYNIIEAHPKNIDVQYIPGSGWGYIVYEKECDGMYIGDHYLLLKDKAIALPKDKILFDNDKNEITTKLYGVADNAYYNGGRSR